jgi:hypothetical protein
MPPRLLFDVIVVMLSLTPQFLMTGSNVNKNRFAVFILSGIYSIILIIIKIVKLL